MKMQLLQAGQGSHIGNEVMPFCNISTIPRERIFYSRLVYFKAIGQSVHVITQKATKPIQIFIAIRLP